MRYTIHCSFCLPFPLMTLSLFVNMSAPGSTVWSDDSDTSTPLAHPHPQNEVPWSLDHFLKSTDAVEALFVGASAIFISTASSSVSDQSTTHTAPPRINGATWMLNQFVTHTERIDEILKGMHGRAAAKSRHRTLLAQMDSFLACLQPNIERSHHDLE